MKNETTLFITSVLALVLVGVLMVYSASMVDPDQSGIFYRHMVYLGLGLAGMYIGARFDYHRLADPAIFRGTVLIVTTLLVLVLIPGIGVEVDGGQRWLSLGFVGFQPSELAKFGLVLLLAVKLTQNQEEIKSFFKGFVPPAILAALFAGLVLLERDLGTPAIMAGVAYIMLFVAGVRWRYLIGSLIPVGALFVVMIRVAPHRVQRLLAFLNPWDYREEAGWQLIQSYSAFARGGVWGQGAGAGEQKLGYLPAAHTDFIFSVVGEEFGLVGTATVVVLFAILLLSAGRIAMYARDQFGGLLAGGIVTLIALQAVFIMAVTTGLLPTKGLPLPFISYGGTALVVFLGMSGVVVNVGVQAREPSAERKRFATA